MKVRVYSLNEELRPARRPATLTFVVSPSQLILCKQGRIEVWRAWKRVVGNEAGFGNELLSATSEIEKQGKKLLNKSRIPPFFFLLMIQALKRFPR